jgi:hypothetical protein
VRVSEVEEAEIERRAAALGLSKGAYLAEAGLAAPGGNPADRSRRDEAVRAALEVRAQIAWVGNNLNQLALVANSTGVVHGPQLEQVLRRVVEIVGEADVAVAELRRS